MSRPPLTVSRVEARGQAGRVDEASTAASPRETGMPAPRPNCLMSCSSRKPASSPRWAVASTSIRVTVRKTAMGSLLPDSILQGRADPFAEAAPAEQ